MASHLLLGLGLDVVPARGVCGADLVLDRVGPEQVQQVRVLGQLVHAVLGRQPDALLQRAEALRAYSTGFLTKSRNFMGERIVIT